jgi:hypothetical protein
MEWPRKGETQQQEGQEAQQEKKKVPQLLVPNRPLAYLAQVHERGEFHPAGALPPDEVEQYRDRSRQHPPEE